MRVQSSSGKKTAQSTHKRGDKTRLRRVGGFFGRRRLSPHLTQQMIGCIKAISPCVKSASAKLFLDLHTVLARVVRSAERVQPHRSNALDGAAAALTVARTRGVAMPL